ncbi:MAG: hypothetical protein JKY48_20535 [Flavobacteriales bacterium]|nr:hypothetical protein [Flavobacteriales bacterium]
MKQFIFFFLLIPMVSISQPITNGLIGNWPMDDDALDLSGNANHGTVFGVLPEFDRNNSPSSAYVFDLSQYISIGDPSEYDFGSQEFSVSIWINRTQTTTNWNNIVLGKWNTDNISGTNEWLLAASSTIDNNYPEFHVEIGSTTYSVTSSSELLLNKWYHLVAIRKTNILELYLDGVLVGINNTVPTGSINMLQEELFNSENLTIMGAQAISMAAKWMKR